MRESLDVALRCHFIHVFSETHQVIISTYKSVNIVFQAFQAHSVSPKRASMVNVARPDTRNVLLLGVKFKTVGMSCAQQRQ